MNPQPAEKLPDSLEGHTSNASRLLLSLLCGVVAAGFLTWFMHMLIASGDQRLDDSERVFFADFIHAKQPETTRRKERTPERPKETETPPTPQASDSNDNLDGNVLSISNIGFDNQIANLNNDFGFSGDGEFLPIVKVAPIYPSSAKSRGIEGDCMVRYRVTATGSVEDVVVLEDECVDKVFYKPSMEAARKFKYKPRVINGTPVEVLEVYNRFTYRLSKR